MMMKKRLLLQGLNFLCSRPSINHKANPNYYKLCFFTPHSFYTSKPDSSSENPNSRHFDNPSDVDDDVTREELKAQIDKFYKGDFEAIPTIFESILKRKLAGKHQDSDDELMNEFRQAQPDVVDIHQHFDSTSNSDSDSD
ncbi:hypothetical protein M8C21_000172 [Ambrosia artemisiifolia]|uniref:Uncharacterized protein n=1 Tax=Ambrosia artemisiifolia TaxID=4212 RepID=A0AAD5CJS7_AMBAR|nr:hypothetical protein M8C21_000172 [Ambrosia artemisiifolia]